MTLTNAFPLTPSEEARTAVSPHRCLAAALIASKMSNRNVLCLVLLQPRVLYMEGRLILESLPSCVIQSNIVIVIAQS